MRQSTIYSAPVKAMQREPLLPRLQVLDAIVESFSIAGFDVFQQRAKGHLSELIGPSAENSYGFFIPPPRSLWITSKRSWILLTRRIPTPCSRSAGQHFPRFRALQEGLQKDASQ